MLPKTSLTDLRKASKEKLVLSPSPVWPWHQHSQTASLPVQFSLSAVLLTNIKTCLLQRVPLPQNLLSHHKKSSIIILLHRGRDQSLCLLKLQLGSWWILSSFKGGEDTWHFWRKDQLPSLQVLQSMACPHIYCGSNTIHKLLWDTGFILWNWK